MRYNRIPTQETTEETPLEPPSPPLSSRLLEIAAINYYDDPGEADIENCNCIFLQSFANNLMPHTAQAISDGDIAVYDKHDDDEDIRRKEQRQKTSQSKRTRPRGPYSLPIKIDKDDDDATTTTAATEECSFAAWSIGDLPQSPPMKSSLKKDYVQHDSSISTIPSDQYLAAEEARVGLDSKRSSTSSDKRVSFVSGYVSEVHIKPRTSEEDFDKLFYTQQEIQSMWDGFIREQFQLQNNGGILEEDVDPLSQVNHGVPIIVATEIDDGRTEIKGYRYSDDGDDNRYSSEEDNDDNDLFTSLYRTNPRRPRSDAVAEKDSGIPDP